MIPISSKDVVNFSFDHESLAWQISQRSTPASTGYWQHEFQQLSNPNPLWYLALRQGRAVFSGSELITAQAILAIAERYLPSLRHKRAAALMQSLKQKLSHDVKYRASIIPVLLESCHRLNIFSPQQLRQALHLSLLRELDNVLFGSSGQASFLQQPELADQLPINGFELSSLVEEVRRRRMIWHQIKKIIPTPDTHLALNNEEIERVSLPSEHRERLVSLLKCGQTPSAISQTLCQDELAITKRLAQLVHQGLIVPQVANKGNRAAIVIVDDSQLMLQMFQALVSGWGYDVYSHTDPQSALQIMLNAAPAAIFLDVNMPEISGFDLLKQIRRQPSLREIPLIMLTAERTLSNNWRAQWSGCQFLSKPLSPDEVPQFRLDLRMLLEAVTQ